MGGSYCRQRSLAGALRSAWLAVCFAARFRGRGACGGRGVAQQLECRWATLGVCLDLGCLRCLLDLDSSCYAKMVLACEDRGIVIITLP